MREALFSAVVLLSLSLLGPGVAEAQHVSLRPMKASAPAFAQRDTARYVSYYDTTETAYFYALPADSARLTVRFSPPITGVVDSVLFAVNDSGAKNPMPVAGEGRLRVRLADTTLQSGTGANAVIVPGAYRDSASIPLGEIHPGAINAIDLPGVAVNDTTDYIVEFDVIAAPDSVGVQFVLDGGATDPDDENYFPARTRLFRAFPDTTGYFTFVCDDQATCGEDRRQNANLAAGVRIAGSVGAGVAEGGDGRGGLSLGANYPNPFREATRIPFTLERPAHARLAVYDVLGRRVAVLIDRQLSAGGHAARWQAGAVPSGTYFVRLTAGSDVRTQAITVIR